MDANENNPDSTDTLDNPNPSDKSNLAVEASFSTDYHGEAKMNNIAGCTIRNDQEVRIVILGKTGSGKSATGNSILGRQCFESNMWPRTVTFECAKGQTVVVGQKVAVVDSPGLLDTWHDIDKTTSDICQCISYASPGPHIFLVVIRLGRFTREESEMVQKLQEIFGEAADRYSMVLFTGGDLLEDAIEEFLEESLELQNLMARCNNQYHVFNNESKDRTQVKELLQKIRTIVQKNGGSHYTNEMFQEAERAIEAEKEQILKEKEEKIRQDREEIENKLYKKYIEKINTIQEGFMAENERLKHQMVAEKKSEKAKQDAEKEQQQQKDKEKMEKLTDQIKKEYQEDLDSVKKMLDDKKEKEAKEARQAAERFNPLFALVKAGKVLMGTVTKLA